MSRSNFKRSQLCRIISTTPASISNVSAISHAFETFSKKKKNFRHHLLCVIYYLFFEFITSKTFSSFKKRKEIKNLTPLPQLSEPFLLPFRFTTVKLSRSLSKRFAKVSGRGRDRLSSDRLKRLSGCFVPRRVHDESKHGRFPPMEYPAS